MSISNVAEEYFKNINSIAHRLTTDLNEVKSAYEGLWSNLTQKEKEQILNESVIKPEISIKYNLKEKQQLIDDYNTLSRIEDNVYRDEHSTPFSFFTQSQRNLNLFNIDKNPSSVEKSSGMVCINYKRKILIFALVCYGDIF